MSSTHSFPSVYIVSAQRTAIGSFQGALSTLSAVQLGAHAIRSAMKQSDIQPEWVDECIMGQVLTAGSGQAPSRQAALSAGMTPATPCLTVNKVCGSGLKAVMLGSDAIQLGRSHVVLAGGQESMSQAPHLFLNSRKGYRLGHFQTFDSLIKDGLWDPYHDWHMGEAAEYCVTKYQFSREEQDQFARESYERALQAQSSGLFKAEISGIEISSKTSQQPKLFDTDEEPSNAQFEKMIQLKPAFNPKGTITAANASKINDGGAALVLASEQAVKKYQLKPIAKLIGQATHAQEPKWFTTAPTSAIQKLLKLTDKKMSDVDLWEINEAFSTVTMAAMKDLEIKRQKVNVHGGAVALGHPIGASGARILTTLIYALKHQNLKTGVASLCIGGGEAVAVMVEII